MKCYKIDLSKYTDKIREIISEKIQEHAKSLGWKNNSLRASLNSFSFIYLDEQDIKFGVGANIYDDSKNEEISANDFLKLTKDEIFSLKPCLFCGCKEPRIYENFEGFKLVCPECGMGTVDSDFTKNFCINRWNARVGNNE